jgi:hypothetical protein
MSALSTLSFSSANASECVVDGWLRAPTVVTVQPSGAEKFRVALFDSTRVTASLSKKGIRVSVSKPLAFVGNAKSLVVRVNRPVVVANGQVLLAPGSELLVTRVESETVFGNVLIEWAPDRHGCGISVDEIVETVGVPCDAIGLPDVWEQRGVPYTYAARPGDGTEIRVLPDYSPAELALRLTPQSARSAVILAKGVRGDCELKVMEKRGPWLHVLRDGPWARITGWVNESEIDHPRRPHESIGVTPDACLSYVQSGSGGYDIEYNGPAKVRAGTVVGPGAWARVPEETTLGIIIRKDRSEVALHLRGMSLVPKSADAFFDFYLQWIPAWIPRAAAILPDASGKSSKDPSGAVEQGVEPDGRSPAAPARRLTP